MQDTTTSKTEELEYLCSQWVQAKASEDAQREYRVKLEKQILEHVGSRKEGAQTVNAPHFKITTTGKLSRAVDWEVWDTIAPEVPPSLHPVKVSRSLDVKGLHYLERNEPEVYRKILECITTKPAKTAVKIEPQKEAP